MSPIKKDKVFHAARFTFKLFYQNFSAFTVIFMLENLLEKRFYELIFEVIQTISKIFP
jgi:hypothetical protein